MIYLDNSATTRTFPEAAEAAFQAMTEEFFNPAAAYAFGARTEKRVNEARQVAARPFRAKREEIIFTSGGTESNNAAVFGSLRPWHGPCRVITTAVEHPSIYETVQSLQRSGDVDIVILPEGYTADEMPQFLQHCQSLVDVFTQVEPFASHINDFNFRAVLAPSEESGVDIPASHTWVRTILNAHFYTFYIDRYCTTRNYFSVKDVAANAPYDQIYILVNSSQYGGGGFYNYYSMSTAGNMSSSSVIIHEFGHAFAGLGDEYVEQDNPLGLLYNLNVEPWEPNLTTLVDFESKWADLVAPGTPIPTPNTSQYYNTVGAFQGAGYLAQGMYRPQQHCMMRDYYPFCAVCSRTIEAVIEAHSDVLVTGNSEQTASEPSLRVCPNPADDYIDVFVNQEDRQAEIIDVNGKTVKTMPVKNGVNRVVVSDLPKGLYLLRTHGETQKFVKQ